MGNDKIIRKKICINNEMKKLDETKCLINFN